MNKKPKTNSEDPFAGQKIRCFICAKKIKKGEKYWHLGAMITCQDCHKDFE